MANQSRRHVPTIGPYQLLQLIGFGPISHLYLARREKGLREPLALKLIETPPQMFQQEHRHVFFTQEVDQLMHLIHRSLLPLLDAGIYEGSPYLVYPYVKSGSLADYLTLHPTPQHSLDEALLFIYQLGEALEAAHEAQIVHGNLKPTNIFLLPGDAQAPTPINLASSVAALADYTLDSLTKGMRTVRLHSTASARYMAPEQFWGARSRWSDQYSLACIAYELLTGKPVFAEHGFHLLESMHALQEPVPPSLLVPSLPHEIDRALLKALSKRVGDRYLTIQAFLAALTTPSPAYARGPVSTLVPETIIEEQPFVSTGQFILPFLSDQGTPETHASENTQSVAALPGDQRARQFKGRQHQRLTGKRWLAEQVKMLLYQMLAVCSWLITWCGELWSALTLLFLVMRDRRQLRQRMQESIASLPVARPQAMTSSWRITLLSSWQWGISRKRWHRKRLFNPNRPRRRTSRQLKLLLLCFLIGASLCLSGVFLLYNLVNHQSVPFPKAIQLPFNGGTPVRTFAPVTVPIQVLESTPTPTPTPTLTPTPLPTPTSKPVPISYPCQVHYGLVTQWPGGFEVEFIIQNHSETDINGWVLQFSFPGRQRISQVWNGRFSQNGSQVSISALSYNTRIPAGGTLQTSPGFTGTWRGSNPEPTRFTLNGSLCTTI